MSSFPPLAGDRCAVVAHRGASRAARENTLEAFAKAEALRADAVELDVRRTADGSLVVHHDAAVEPLGAIVEHTLDDLRAAAPFVPELEDALRACGDLWVNVEIKNLPTDPDWDPDQGVAERVAELVGRHSLHDRVLVSSFNPLALARVREVDATVATALLTVGSLDAAVAVDAAEREGHAALNPGADALVRDDLEEVISAAHERGLAIVPWTVDEPAEMQALVDAGVDGLITNVPDVARKIVG